MQFKFDFIANTKVCRFLLHSDRFTAASTDRLCPSGKISSTVLLRKNVHEKPPNKTHNFSEVSLHQTFGIQLRLKAAHELHELIHSETINHGLILLNGRPAQVLQNQKPHVPEENQRNNEDRPYTTYTKRGTMWHHKEMAIPRTFQASRA